MPIARKESEGGLYNLTFLKVQGEFNLSQVVRLIIYFTKIANISPDLLSQETCGRFIIHQNIIRKREPPTHKKPARGLTRNIPLASLPQATCGII